MSNSERSPSRAGLPSGSPVAGGLHYSSVAVLGAVFFASLALLSLQLTTSRLLSAVLSHHYAFAILSLAMLGLGLGGVLTHWVHARRRPPQNATRLLVWYGLLTACSVPLATGAVIWMAGQPAFYDKVAAYFVFITLPFTLGGLFFAEIYRQYSLWAGRLYGFDLVGAALGGAVAVVLLDAAGGVGGTLFLSALMALATAWLAWGAVRPLRRLGIAAAVVMAASVSAALVVTHDSDLAALPKTVNPDKEIYDALHGPWNGRITDTRWTAFGRTQLITYRDNPDHRDIYIDGTAGTPMYRFSGDFTKPGSAVQNLFQQFPGAVPFLFMPPDQRNTALVIGPGGGRDVLLAAGAGFAHIEAAEVNPDLLALMEAHADYNGGLFTDFDHIRVHQAEGRHFVQRSMAHYDLIMMSLPVTNTSRSREGFSLTESYLLTEQAIGDYLDHLADAGQLVVITHDELAVVRLLRIALDAMSTRGLTTQAAMNHIYVLGSFPYPIVVIGKQPFTAEQSHGILREVLQRDYSVAASYAPHLQQPGAGNPMLQALAQGRVTIDQVTDYVAEQGHNISAVTDNRPFFYRTDPGLPGPLKLLSSFALGAAALALALPVVVGLRQPAGKRRRLIRSSLLFALLGTGFMLAEIALIQRLTFFLGEPVLALAVLLGSMLVFMGVGSLLSGRIPAAATPRWTVIAALGVACLTLTYAAWLPSLLLNLLADGLVLRVVWSVVLIAPLGVLLGIPFPLALRGMHQADAGWGVPWMWAINGVFSVLGAAAAVVIAMEYGLAQVMMAAGVAYLLLALVALCPARLGNA